MSAWIYITIAAAFFQTIRSALQKRLKGDLGTWGATAARFVYAAPLAVAFATLLLVTSVDRPALPGQSFIAMVAVGATAQIVATALLIHLFSFRNFAVGTALSKTEVIQTALFGLIILGEGLSVWALLAVGICMVGVFLIALKTADVDGVSIFDPKARIGIASGALFAVSAVCFRGASLSLGDGPALLRASLTLAAALTLQAIIMLIWLRAREPGRIGQLAAEWKVAGLVGLSGMLASVGWFTAMTLENAAYVRAVGQVEIIFTLAITHFYFRERLKALEWGGLALLTLGILGVVLLG